MLFQKIILNSFRALRRGTLDLTLPGGERFRYGGLGAEPAARIAVRNPNIFRRCVCGGPIGFAEGYMAGEWDTPDLTGVIEFFILNAEDSNALSTPRSRSTGLIGLLNAIDRHRHLQRPNSLSKSRDNIRDHYDLSNAFFQIWLDPTMTYSSAWFDPPSLSLEEAQRKKYDRLCRKLQIRPTDHVLEIGTGWGGFSLHAAGHYGCRVTTVTISGQQHAEAAARIAAAGLAGRVEVLMADYRTLTGKFDKIVSIEMLEAVGDRYVDGYFSRCEQLLKPEGLLGLQAILCPDRQYAILRDGVDFIQKHIFPGSLLMSMGRILEATQNTDNLNLFDYADMAPFYARTLGMWRGNFEERIAEVRDLGFDESFLRKWRYYLCYCEAAFATRHITVAQMIFSRPNNHSLRSPAK